MNWQTSRRTIDLNHPVVMAILNVTPDSFSDGGMIKSVDDALRRVEKFVEEGAGIIDVGGESTRPGSLRVSADEEVRRVVPVIEAIGKRFDIPISVDTSKAEVADEAIKAGAEIINDISALRFDERIAQVSASSKAGLVLMHSRGEFESMHSQPPVADVIAEVADGFHSAIATAETYGVKPETLVLDVGIGFGKSPEQNLELLAKLGRLIADFPNYPMLVGASRKSFIGKMLGGVPAEERLSGSLAAAAIAVWNGALIIRAHDVRETVQTIKLVDAIRSQL